MKRVARGAWRGTRGALRMLRGASPVVFCLTSLILAPRVTLGAQRADDATQLLRTGKYDEAAAA